MTSAELRSSRLATFLLLFVCGISLVLGVVRGASIPFWSDEISTMRIATMPTWGEAFRGTQTLDLNPPLEVLLTHATVLALGPHELAGHLPSIVGFTFAVGCVFLFLYRRVSPWFAAFAALLMIQNTEIFYYATEARPYGLLLGMLGLALLGYDALLRNSGGIWARILLFLGIAGMILCHVFSVFPVMAFFLAEFIRTLRRRRIDVGTWLALLLPLGFCVLYKPLFQSHGVLIHPPDQRVHLMAAFRLYIYMLLMPMARVLAAALVVLLLVRRYPEPGFVSWMKMPPEEWMLLLVILATPVSVATLLRVQSPMSGYYSRYGLAMVYPGMILLVSWMAWRARESVNVARVLTLFALIGIVFAYRDFPHQLHHLMKRGWLAAPDEAASSGGVEGIYPDLPLVANNGLEFLEADNRLSSADLARFYYLTDTETALRIAHTNSLENLGGLQVPFHIRAHVAPLREFVAEHKDFLVIGELNRSTSWLMKWAIEQHADIRYLGNYTFAGKEMPLWRVTLNPAGNW